MIQHKLIHQLEIEEKICIEITYNYYHINTYHV